MGPSHIRHAMTLALAALATTTTACAARQIDPRAEHATAGGIGWWYAEDTASLDRGEWPVKKLLGAKCSLSKMDPAEGAFFARTAAYVDRVVGSDRFASLVRANTSWEGTKDSGEQILERIQSGGADINVLVYARDDHNPCGDDVARESVNAFTPMRRQHEGLMLFLSGSYLDDTMATGDVRALARTVVHESLHAIGYSHEGLTPDSQRYNNSVPVFVGCLLEKWDRVPDTRALARMCTSATQPSPP